MTISRINSTLCAIMAHFVKPMPVGELSNTEEGTDGNSTTKTSTRALPAFLQRYSEKAKDNDDPLERITEGQRPDKWMAAVYRYAVKKLQDKETAGNKVRTD